VLPHVQRSAKEQLLDRAVAKFQSAVMTEMVGFPRLAIKPLQEAREIVRVQLGPKHIYMGLVLFQLGLAYDEAGDLDQAESTWRECLAIVHDCQILAHPKTILLYHALADLLRRRGKTAEGEQLYQELLDAHAKFSGGRFLPDAQLSYAAWLDAVG